MIQNGRKTNGYIKKDRMKVRYYVKEMKGERRSIEITKRKMKLFIEVSSS
jgi:hypothetical protein